MRTGGRWGWSADFGVVCSLLEASGSLLLTDALKEGRATSEQRSLGGVTVAKQNVGTSGHGAGSPQSARVQPSNQHLGAGPGRPGAWEIGGAEPTFSNGIQAEAG